MEAAAEAGGERLPLVEALLGDGALSAVKSSQSQVSLAAEGGDDRELAPSRRGESKMKLGSFLEFLQAEAPDCLVVQESSRVELR